MKLATIPYLREVGALIALAAVAWALWAAYDFAYDNGYNAANVRAEKIIADMAKGEAAAQARARKAEQALARGVAQAEEDAGERNDQIERDYQRRIAGVVSERDRLRDLWQAERATDRLADSAAAAGAAAEKDRLRRASAARVLRATERAQSERDEAIDRYEAVRRSINRGDVPSGG